MTKKLMTAISLAVLAGATLVAAQASDEKEIASYRLTMATTEKVMAAYRIMSQRLAADPKFAAARQAQAELKTLEAKEDPTDADRKRMEALQAQIDRAGEAFGKDDAPDNETLTDMERRIAKTPYLGEALQSAGLPARDFAKYSLALMQAMMVHGLQKAGTIKEVPAGVNAENVKFVADHEAELTKLTSEMQKLGAARRLGRVRMGVLT